MKPYIDLNDYGEESKASFHKKGKKDKAECKFHIYVKYWWLNKNEWTKFDSYPTAKRRDQALEQLKKNQNHKYNSSGLSGLRQEFKAVDNELV